MRVRERPFSADWIADDRNLATILVDTRLKAMRAILVDTRLVDMRVNLVNTRLMVKTAILVNTRLVDMRVILVDTKLSTMRSTLVDTRLLDMKGILDTLCVGVCVDLLSCVCVCGQVNHAIYRYSNVRTAGSDFYI
jgi:hypothetical protein